MKENSKKIERKCKEKNVNICLQNDYTKKWKELRKENKNEMERKQNGMKRNQKGLKRKQKE